MNDVSFGVREEGEAVRSLELSLNRGHVYNDDEYGTKLIVTRVRPSFVQRLLWSNSASEVQAAPSEPQEPQEPQQHEAGWST